MVSNGVGIVAAVAMVIVVVLAVAHRLPERRISTQIDIDRAPAEVFSVLENFASYPVWNPYHVRVTGGPNVGGRLDLTINKPDGTVVRLSPRVTANRRNEVLAWGGGVRWLVWGNHEFVLQGTEDGGTRLVHAEVFRGIVLPFVPMDGIEEGYRKMNEALKAYLERE